MLDSELLHYTAARLRLAEEGGRAPGLGLAPHSGTTQATVGARLNNAQDFPVYTEDFNIT
jgi:hypothetical protein